MNIEVEKNKLRYAFDDTLTDKLAEVGCHVIGGAVLSIFTNKPINDYDIYCPNQESIEPLIKWLDDNIATTMYSTPRAELMNHSGERVQIIKEFWGTPEEIFEAFDFTCCMGAFSYATETFTLHEDFIKAAGQKRLTINAGTRYPIATLARVKKYAERGYTISNKELLRLALMINRLEINSYEGLISQISGVSTNYYRRIVSALNAAKESGKPFDVMDAIENVLCCGIEE